MDGIFSNRQLGSSQFLPKSEPGIKMPAEDLLSLWEILSQAPLPEAASHRWKNSGEERINTVEGWDAINAADRNHLSKSLGASLHARIREIHQETDPELFGRSILALALEWRRSGDGSRSAALLDWLSRQEEGVVSGPVRAQASKELTVLNGGGHAGQRIELHLSRLAKDATDYRMIVPMMLGTMAFQGAKTLSLGKFAANAADAAFARGYGARFASTMVGFGAELPTFVLSGRVLNEWSGLPVGDLKEEFHSAAITLGALKFFGYLGHQGMVYAKLRPGQFSSTAVSQVSMGLGMAVGHHFTGQSTAPIDILASMLSMGVGAKLGHAVLGPGYANLAREVEWRSKLLVAGYEKNRGGDFTLSLPNLAFASPADRSTMREIVIPTLFAMSSLEGEAGKSRASEKAVAQVRASVLDPKKAQQLLGLVRECKKWIPDFDSMTPIEKQSLLGKAMLEWEKIPLEDRRVQAEYAETLGFASATSDIPSIPFIQELLSRKASAMGADGTPGTGLGHPSEGPMPSETSKPNVEDPVVSPQEVATQRVIRQMKQVPLAELFPNSPADVLELFMTLFPEDLARPDADSLVKTFHALNMQEVAYLDGGPKAPTGPVSKIFIDVLARRRELYDKLSLGKMERLGELFIRLVYRDFAFDQKGLFTYLDELKAKVADPALNGLIEQGREHFKVIMNLQDANIKNPLFLYQRAGAFFLASRPRAMLADEPGLGKTIQALTAVESLPIKKVLIACPNRLTQNWAREIEKHLKHNPGYYIIESADKKYFEDEKLRREWKAEVRAAKYLIVNYEALRIPEVDHEAKDVSSQMNHLVQYLKKEAKLDLIILDESQYVDNPDKSVQQAEGVRAIRPPRRWLLSATPFQSNPEHLFSAFHYLDPDSFPAMEGFRKTFFGDDPNGLKLLNVQLRDFALRRRKEQVLTVVDPKLPLEEQRGSLPRKVRIPYESPNGGGYELSQGQLNEVYQMINGFPKWVEKYNEWATNYNKALGRGAKAAEDRRTIIDVERINPLNKLSWIRRVMTDPGLIGLQGDSPVLMALDKIVEKYLKAGEKPILLANHRRFIDQIMDRYESQGIVRIDGSVDAAEQEYARDQFVNHRKVKILAVNPRSAGVGQSFPNAGAVIAVEAPVTYVVKYQSEDRAHRADPDFTKPKVDYLQMVATYPKEWLESLPQEVRRYFDVGTVSQLEIEELKRREIDYFLVMEGYKSKEDFEAEIRSSISQKLGWSKEE